MDDYRHKQTFFGRKKRFNFSHLATWTDECGCKKPSGPAAVVTDEQSRGGAAAVDWAGLAWA